MIYTYFEKSFDLPGPMIKAMDLDGEHHLVIVEPVELQRESLQNNMFCLHKSGKILWTVQSDFKQNDPGGAEDHFTNCWLDDDGALIGYYSLGFECKIDPKTGKVLEQRFTK